MLVYSISFFFLSLSLSFSVFSMLAVEISREDQWLMIVIAAGYFSFPSFEDFQGYQEPNERMERKSVS